VEVTLTAAITVIWQTSCSSNDAVLLFTIVNAQTPLAREQETFCADNPPIDGAIPPEKGGEGVLEEVETFDRGESEMTPTAPTTMTATAIMAMTPFPIAALRVLISYRFLACPSGNTFVRTAFLFNYHTMRRHLPSCTT